MGQIADDMADGTVCTWCGELFADPDSQNKCFTHGYPVVCASCAEGYSKDYLNSIGLSIAVVPTLGEAL